MDEINRALLNIINRSDWRRALAQDYQSTANRLQQAYGRVTPLLQRSANELTQRMQEWVTSNPDDTLGATRARGFKEFQNLLARIEAEMSDFAVLLRTESGGLQERAAVTGEQAALQMAVDTAPNLAGQITGAWNQVDPQTLENLIGYVDSTAFRQKARAFGENAADSISDVILSGVAQGKNPRAIASLLTKWLALPYSWAENTARTVQLWSYRTASHASYASNANVLDGWVWTATLDTRTCLSCISQHGTLYPLDSVLNDHHRGRCTPVPKVKGTRWYDRMQTGTDWFEGLSPATQQEMMGYAMYNAWSSGVIKWRDMSQPYQDDVYGEMLREASVLSVLGNQASQYYATANTR